MRPFQRDINYWNQAVRDALADERKATVERIRAALDVERLARALELELNRTHRAGHYDELAAAIKAAYDAEGEQE